MARETARLEDLTGTRLEKLSAAQVAAALGLLPHREGGYFRETYRSPVAIPTPVGARPLSTAIIYLLTAHDPSRFHRLRFDEVWFFHAGSPVEMLFLDPLETYAVGPHTPQALAPGGRWMGARVAEPVARPGWALVGCVVSPGFEYDDFEMGNPETLLSAYPEAAEQIDVLS